MSFASEKTPLIGSLAQAIRLSMALLIVKLAESGA